MKAKFRIGQKIYIHGRKPGKIRKISAEDNAFVYLVEPEGEDPQSFTENEISFFKQ